MRRNSFGHAVVRNGERWLLDSALESQQACSPFIEQKPSELVARPFTVAVYFYVHHGIHGNRQCASASHNWFGWVLDARSLRLLRSRALDRSDSCLPDISRKHHRGLVLDAITPTSTLQRRRPSHDFLGTPQIGRAWFSGPEDRAERNYWGEYLQTKAS